MYAVTVHRFVEKCTQLYANYFLAATLQYCCERWYLSMQSDINCLLNLKVCQYHHFSSPIIHLGRRKDVSLLKWYCPIDPWYRYKKFNFPIFSCTHSAFTCALHFSRSVHAHCALTSVHKEFTLHSPFVQHSFIDQSDNIIFWLIKIHRRSFFCNFYLHYGRNTM